MHTSSVLCLLSAAAVLVTTADAYERYVDRVPNGANVKGVDAVGHVDPSGGGPRNPFGLAFADADHKWTKQLCQADSDSDGQTNGQELGDPCCVWTEGGTPQYSTGVSAPGDATSKADPSLWASAACAGGSANTSPSTAPSSSAPASASPSTTAPAPSTPAPTTSSSASLSPAMLTALAAGAVALTQL